MPDTVAELIAQLESLRVQETDILQRLVAARTAESGTHISTTSEPQSIVHYKIGDAVYITSKIRTSFGRQLSLNDRKGTVTKLTKKRVFIRTNNGTNTNRAPENLRLLSKNTNQQHHHE